MYRLRHTMLAAWFLLCANARATEIAVIAHPDTSVASISVTTIANLFLVSNASWPGGAVVIPYDLPDGSTLRSEFYEKLTGRSAPQMRLYWARIIFSGSGAPPLQVESTPAMLQRVAATRGAIGYVPREQVDNRVKVIAILH